MQVPVAPRDRSWGIIKRRNKHVLILCTQQILSFTIEAETTNFIVESTNIQNGLENQQCHSLTLEALVSGQWQSRWRICKKAPWKDSKPYGESHNCVVGQIWYQSEHSKTITIFLDERSYFCEHLEFWMEEARSVCETLSGGHMTEQGGNFCTSPCFWSSEAVIRF